MKLGILGAGGRMGLAVTRAADERGLEIVAAVDRGDKVGRDLGELAGLGARGVVVTDDLAVFEACDAIVDFSLPGAARELYERAAAWKMPVATGTTGLDAEAQAALEKLADVAPVVAAPNFSQGVTLLFHLAREACTRLGDDFDAEIVELHHRRKIDAPSGTAVRLAEVVTEARSIGKVLHGRSGEVGARTDDELAVLAVRAGDIVGEHTLYLAGPGERLELTHRATDRAIFARGAVRAAVWAVGRPAGRYGMEDVMGLR
ncbi:MAG: 4-hydroxy-tetrahydrodipicolinate reductase [Sandaracinus sp.]|nr:4-hydroxy-tetrahydrodipicolinate reductase [Sandaracinus sp.]MCB9635768.1 4-hydroxy-tetrahydrodipicolinate reductase [Sandaracinus sp.]